MTTESPHPDRRRGAGFPPESDADATEDAEASPSDELTVDDYTPDDLRSLDRPEDNQAVGGAAIGMVVGQIAGGVVGGPAGALAGGVAGAAIGGASGGAEDDGVAARSGEPGDAAPADADATVSADAGGRAADSSGIDNSSRPSPA